MFIIIGGDGREYGPATADQVRAWINGGRANLETKAKLAGANEWCRLGDFPEFGGAAEPPSIAAPADPTAAEARPAAEPAGVGARTGAALINAFIYFCSLLPGGLWLSRKLIEANPDLAKGGFPKLEDLDMTGVAEGVFQEVGEGPFHEEPFPPGEARPFHLHEEPPPLRLVPVAEEEVLGQGPEVQGLAPGGAGLEAGEGEEVLRQAVAPGELLPQGAEEGDAPLLPQIVRPLQVVQEAQGGKEGGLEVVGQGGVQGLPGLQELLEPGEEEVGPPPQGLGLLQAL